MAPPKKSVLPKPLPDGFILTDTGRKKWRLGKIIGQGGFGLIYLASQDVDRPVAPDTDFVIKLEYHENGPLFSELKFYQRAAKAETRQTWMKNKKIDFLGIPTYWGSGQADYNNLRYRFMAMDRLGTDLQKICDGNGGRLKKATALQLCLRMVDVLEYIHENEYVHSDIKAANLLQDCRDPEKIYLVDYGLAYRYCPDGVHKEFQENPKKGHNGTMEYTSLDAHRGTAPSRRSDLQILGFCLLHWLCGSLPWDSVLKNPAQVLEAKTRLMENLPQSVLQLSRGSTDEAAAFLSYVQTLGYAEKPDYRRVKGLLSSGAGGRLDLSVPQGARTPAATTRTKVKPAPPKDKQKRVRARAGAASKPVMDGEEEEGEEPRPTPARRRRGPADAKPQSNEVSPELRRSRRIQNKPVYTCEDESDESEEEEEEEEEEVTSKRIPARYIRGPPIRPKSPSEP